MYVLMVCRTDWFNVPRYVAGVFQRWGVNNVCGGGGLPLSHVWFGCPPCLWLDVWFFLPYSEYLVECVTMKISG